LNATPWDLVNGPDPRKGFYKWATTLTKEGPGISLYFVAMSLEKGGHLLEAVKAYHACLVFYPGAHGLTFWNTPWYIGPTAVDRILFILKKNPQLGLKLDGADVQIINGFDADLTNDRVVCNPGRLVKASPREAAEASVPTADLTKEKSAVVFAGKSVKLIRYGNGHWRLFVDGKPYFIRGMVYQPNPVGTSPDNGSLKPTEDWQSADINKNGLVDGPFDAWVDKNRNDVQDPDEKPVGDFALMRDMGVNTVRIYHHVFNRSLIDTLYSKYGIRIVLGDLLGAYTVGSGADWAAGTDYTNVEQRARMLDSVRQMVLEYKDDPAVLMWMLGNENVYGTNTNAPTKPAAFFSLVNEAAKMIKSIDKNHPVAVSNGDVLDLDVFAKNAPDVDIFGCNSYRGDHGFGRSLFTTVRQLTGKPVIVTEFGCPAYNKDRPQEAENLQAQATKDYCEDLWDNGAGRGVGNALGGFVFEWVDEWWKAGSACDPSVHVKTGQWQGPFPDGWMYEEWLGVTSQGNGKNTPFLRQLRKAYFTLKDLWKNEETSK
jgi:beta-glucuronidase